MQQGLGRAFHRLEGDISDEAFVCGTGAEIQAIGSVDHYKLGDGEITLTKEHVSSAISIMKLTSILFFGIVIVPIISVLTLIGWWIHA